MFVNLSFADRVETACYVVNSSDIIDLDINLKQVGRSIFSLESDAEVNFDIGNLFSARFWLHFLYTKTRIRPFS